MRNNYTLWLLDGFGKRIKIIQDWYVLEYTRAFSAVTTLRLELTEIPWYQLERDMRIAVWRNNVLEDVFLLAHPRIERGQYKRVILNGVGLNDILRRRVVPYDENTSQGYKEGIPADTAMWQVVNENMGSSAASDRSLTGYITILQPKGVGPLVYVKAAWRKVIDVLQEIQKLTESVGQPVYFNLSARTETDIVFETRVGRWGYDRTLGSGSPVIFSRKMGNAERVITEKRWQDEVTALYAIGAGTEKRDMALVLSTDRIGVSPFARVEDVYQASSATGNALDDKAKSEAWKRRQVSRQYVNALDTKMYPYRVAWDVGDTVTVMADDVSFDAVIQAVQVRVTDHEEITPKLVTL